MAYGVSEDDRLKHDKALEHCWRYFQLHAAQRLTVFNFFVVLAGLMAAGLSATLQGSPRYALVGVILGFLLSLLSYVFWKLDQRGSFLIKHAEEAVSAIEVITLPEVGRLFSREPEQFRRKRFTESRWYRPWTFGECFRLVFAAMAAFGIGGAIVAGCRAAGSLSWT